MHKQSRRTRKRKTNLKTWSESKVAQSCPTLCDPVDCTLPGSSVHGIFQTIVLEWIAISFSRGSSQTRDWTRVSLIVDRHFTIWATREVKYEESLKDLCWGWNELRDWDRHIYTTRYNIGEGNGTPLHYSGLENLMGGGAW